MSELARPPRARRLVRLSIALVAVALALAAAASSATRGGERAGSAAAPKTTYLAVVPGLMSNLDAATYQGRSTTVEIGSAYQAQLLRPKEIAIGAKELPGPSGWEPYLATSYTRQSDGSYVFKLRTDAKSNAGNPLTAEDVKWSFERLVAIDSIGRFILNFGNVDQKNPITVIDRSTVRLNVTAPGSLTLGAIHYPMMSILDSVEVKKHVTAADPWAKSWMSTHSASFGPYYVDAFAPAQSLLLRANPNHWAPLYFKTAVIRAVPDSQSRLSLAVKGLVTRATSLEGRDYNEVTLAKDKVDASLGISPIADNLYLNAKLKPLADVRVRRAIAMAIDRDALNRLVYKGLGKPALYVIPSAVNRPAPLGEVPIKYDVPAARALLAEAGYANGFSFTVTGNSAAIDGFNDLATLIQSQLAPLGIKMGIELVATPAEYEARRGKSELEAWMARSVPAINDANYILNLGYATGTIGNRFGYSNPKFDALSNGLFRTPPGKRYNRILKTVTQIIQTDLPAVPLMETPTQMVFQKGIKGYNPNPAGVMYIDRLSR